MELWVVRHGQTVANKEHRIQGWMESPLNELGLEQAKRLGERLRGEHFDHIYASPLGRVQETAKQVLKYHSSTPYDVVDDLKERSLGIYEGKLDAEIPNILENVILKRVEGGESLDDLKDRVADFIEKIARRHPGQKVLFLGHFGTVASVISIVTKAPMSEVRLDMSCKNCSINKFEVESDLEGRILALNDYEHIRDLIEQTG